MAAPDGKISVELQLLMDTAMKQASAAASAMAKEFAKVGLTYQPAKMAAATDKVTAAENKATTAVKERTKATRELSAAQQRLKDIASGKLSPVQPGQTVTIAGTNATNKTYGPGAIIPGGIGGNTTATAPGFRQPLNNSGFGRLGTLFNPLVPHVGQQAPPPANAFKQIAPLLAAAIGTGVGGPLGGAIAGVLTKMNPAVAAVTASMTALRYAAGKVGSAMERARGIYARMLTSGGMAPGFIVQRAQLAGVLGVSEDSVIQYGRAIGFLNEKLSWSSKILTETNPTVTALGWEFKVTQQNMHAMWASLANDAAPAIEKFLSKINQLSKSAVNVADGIAKQLELNKRLLDFSEKYNELQYRTKFDKSGNITFDKFVGPDGKPLGEWMQKKLKSLFDNFQINGERSPSIPTSINRMPSSNWESMGMVLGIGVSQNWNQKTAQGVAKLVSINEKLLSALTNRKPGNDFYSPYAAQV